MSPNEFQAESERLYARLEKSRKPERFVLGSTAMEVLYSVTSMGAMFGAIHVFRKGAMAGLNIQSVDALSPLAVAGLNLSTMAGGMVAGLAITFAVMKSSMFRPGIPIGVAINAKKQEQLDTWVKEHPRLEGIVKNWQGQNRHGKITTREFGEIEETVSDLKRVHRSGP